MDELDCYDQIIKLCWLHVSLKNLTRTEIDEHIEDKLDWYDQIIKRWLHVFIEVFREKIIYRETFSITRSKR